MGDKMRADKIRRGFSILLVLLFGLGPLASALDLDGDAGLPACCRRLGAHHCAMAAEMARAMAQVPSGSAPMVTAPLTCPLYPGPAALMAGPAPALVRLAAAMPALHRRAFTPATRRTAVSSRSALAHAGRGPPTAI
jgi:hypothetical protein